MSDRSNTPPYPAKDLDLSLRQVRLVTILPGQFNDDIVCELSTTHVDDLPEYYTLSYAWGNRQNPKTIRLNGVTYEITRNLYGALRRLRHESESRLFWIDMICINQNRLEERSHQVSLMKLIYSKAQEVCVWIADVVEDSTQEEGMFSLPPESELGFGNVPILSRAEAASTLRYIYNHTNDCLTPFSSDGGPTLAYQKAAISGINKVVSSSWWYRVWTVQEFILPTKVNFVIGDVSMSLDPLNASLQRSGTHIARGCCEVDRVIEALTPLHSLLGTLNGARLSYHDGALHRKNPLELLHEFRRRLSTDPRDKVFGFLGLIDSATGFDIKVDYTRSTEDVFQETFMKLLIFEGSANGLARAWEADRKLGLPSWIPDWSADIREEESLFDNLVHATPAFSACQSTESVFHCPSMTGELNVKGVFFDQVTHVLSADFRAFTLDNNLPSDVNLIKSIQNVCNATGQDAGQYVAGGSLATAFWRMASLDYVVVMGDEDSEIQRASKDDYASYPDTTHLRGTKCVFFDMQKTQVFVTKTGYIGRTRDVEVGDSVCILLGGIVPFVLREQIQQAGTPASRKQFSFIGHCYAQGIMDGEALEGVNIEDVGWITLV